MAVSTTASAVAEPPRHGTVSRCAPPRPAAGPTTAYPGAKALLRSGGAAGAPALPRREAVAQEPLGSTKDHQGAVRVLLAHRQPSFSGR
ncbi:hypothetical protein [Streptomyces hygroscopicus]|uniref:hypothetical protein n=1 Tax=Streptomyces hygroscopicus TaxID=1912 RepID=UPI0022406A27|nr:hypothetical protein [Streptomyces hygroscopicus]